MSIPRFIAGILAAALFAVPALAQIDAAPKATMRLVAEQGEIAPGGSVAVALAQDIRTGWHTYWRNPGDAGAPTTIGWTLPSGWTAGAIEWPYPKRLPAGPLMDYGYEGKPWLLTRIMAPANAKLGDIATLKAHASWLVCSDTLCVPEDQTLGLQLVVAAHPAPPYATIARQFAEARALLPVPSPWPARFADRSTLDLFLAAPGLVPRDAAFFPIDEEVIKGTAPQLLGAAGGGFVLRLSAGAKAKSVQTLGGVLVLTSQDGSMQALSIAAAPGTIPAAHFVQADRSGLALALLFAFLGGLILNLMPCVLPVLAMKALAVASHASASKGEAAREGVSYGAGAVLSFLAFGLAVVLLRAVGEAVGWGFQLQEPRVVAAFALLMFAVGLNLSGVFEWPSGLGAGETLTRQGGVVGAFFTGVLAVAVAAPCTAPFMATAIGFALTQSTAVAFAIFLVLGMGFAAPFVALGLSPSLLRLLPKPGAWMIAFRQLLAFPLYGAAAWLVWVVAQEAGEGGLAAVLVAIVALAFAAWVWTASRTSGPPWRGIGFAVALVGIGLAIAGVLLAQGAATASAALTSEAALAPQPYSAAGLAQLRAQKRPVFVDATAAWCITCMVNEKAALSSPAVADAFRRTHTAFLVADWTKRDAAITALLESQGRSGVPLYLYYKPGAPEPEVLPQILTTEMVLKTIDGG